MRLKQCVQILHMNVYARFDEIASLLLKILRKQNVTNGQTHGRTDGWTDNVKTVYPPTNTVCGGYKNRSDNSTKSSLGTASTLCHSISNFS